MRLTEFRPIPGYEGSYEINGLGAVWSIPRTSHRRKVGPRPAGGQFMTPALDKKGYQVVYLRAQGDSRAKPRFVHQLVAEAFIGPRPDGLVTCHNNGARTDNRVSNLRYDTQAGNLADMVKHGTSAQSAKTTCPMGHEYTRENIDPKYTRGRKCLACKAQYTARRRFVREAARSLSNTMSASLLIADAQLEEAA